MASTFTIHKLHDYALIQSALPDDVTCMASRSGVILYPAFISCGVTYDPRVEVRASHLRPECHRLRIIARSPLLAIAWLTNKPIYTFISLIRSVPCCVFFNDLLHATQQHDSETFFYFCSSGNFFGKLCLYFGSFLWHIGLVCISV